MAGVDVVYWHVLKTIPAACGAGTYRALDDMSCQPCPSNTEMDMMAATECRCLDGFFRDLQQEGPASGCTGENNFAVVE